MLNIVCLKWGTKYGPEYVNKLHASINRNTTVPFRFHCFTDDATGLNPGIVIQPLPYKDYLDGWWNKLYLFSNEINIPKGDKIFYVDLDTVIVDNIDQLLRAHVSQLIVLEDFYWGIAKSAGRMGSGLMLWEHGKYTHVWDNFFEDPGAAIASLQPFGDQHWIDKQVRDRLYWQDLYPNKVVSFKVHCNSSKPIDARIICFHGAPSIPEAALTSGKSWKYTWTPQSWILDHWIEK